MATPVAVGVTCLSNNWPPCSLHWEGMAPVPSMRVKETSYLARRCRYLCAGPGLATRLFQCVVLVAEGLALGLAVIACDHRYLYQGGSADAGAYASLILTWHEKAMVNF